MPRRPRSPSARNSPASRAALTDLRIEARDAEQELARRAGEAPDWIDQRLRRAAEAAHGAFVLAGELDDVGREVRFRQQSGQYRGATGRTPIPKTVAPRKRIIANHFESAIRA